MQIGAVLFLLVAAIVLAVPWDCVGGLGATFDADPEKIQVQSPRITRIGTNYELNSIRSELGFAGLREKENSRYFLLA